MPDDLPPKLRAVVVLRYWYDYSYAEIADIMDTTESAVKASENLLAAHAAGGGLKGIFCPSESTTFGMLLARSRYLFIKQHRAR